MICSGNICRSPMAEVIGRRLLDEAGIDADVSSAGTLRIEDQPAARNARHATLEIGLDLEQHRSQGISFEIIDATDVFIVMSPEHEHGLRELSSAVTGKIERLWEHTDEPGRLDEIRDPVGQDVDAFRRCRDEIVECLRNWVASLASERSSSFRLSTD
jgi:protein-tyrosine-phosphatase